MFDFLILGAGAAGLMAGIESSRRGLKVAILEKLPQAGRKILISGGGRCNYTNLGTNPAAFQSGSAHFMKSALREWTPEHTLQFFENLGIKPKEKKLGQIFPVSDSAVDVRDALLSQYLSLNGSIFYQHEINSVEKKEDFFQVNGLDRGTGKSFGWTGRSLLVATGGKAYPQLGASDFSLKLAEQFSLGVTETAPALVPLTLENRYIPLLRKLSGLSLPVKMETPHPSSGKKISFEENLLFAHFGISGPAVLQTSSYWREGQSARIHFLPKDLAEIDPSSRTQNPKERDFENFSARKLSLETILVEARRVYPSRKVGTLLAARYPENFLTFLDFHSAIPNTTLAELRREDQKKLLEVSENFSFIPDGTMGYAKAEVMRGGVDTSELHASTMESKKISGLYFAGESVDVTGWLGGYNFQWAWASGFVVGKNVRG